MIKITSPAGKDFPTLQRKFNKLARKIKKLSPLYKAIGIKLLNQISEYFDKESIEGKPWKRLSVSTIMARRKGKNIASSKGVKILQDTGKLRASFAMSANNSRVIVFPGGKPGREYAAQHEFGIGVPRRPFMPPQWRALTIAIEQAERFIEKNLGGAGL